MEVCLPQEFYFLCVIFLVCVLPLVKQVNHLTLDQLVICSDLYHHTCSGSDGKESAYICRRPGFNSWDGKIPCRRERQLTPVFFLGEFHGQRSLADYSPWGHKESDTTEQLTHLYLAGNPPAAHEVWPCAFSPRPGLLVQFY